jgi:hypothetical protein
MVSPLRRTLRLALLAPLLAATSLTAVPAHATGDPSLVAHATVTRRWCASDGVVRGAVHDGGRLFAGIPYAAPPVGALRFRPPAPVTPWPGTLNATWPRAQCAQGGSSYALPSYDEDCLYLNVYTPPVRRHAGPLPVMVWIHGGAFENGSGSSYNAERDRDQGRRRRRHRQLPARARSAGSCTRDWTPRRAAAPARPGTTASPTSWPRCAGCGATPAPSAATGAT